MSNSVQPASIRVRFGQVQSLVKKNEALCEAVVALDDGSLGRAIGYVALTGPLKVGDRVALNTTAVDLGLGTGGVHFVMAVVDQELEAKSEGHIMKLRYTPSQLKVLAVDEEKSPHRGILEHIPDLLNIPVLVGGLHSQLPIAAGYVKAQWPNKRVAYVMTDGAALPAAFSHLVERLKGNGLIDVVITAGHAFGGDLEAVTAPSALAAAKEVARADLVIVTMGPGVVGTGTPLGTTALEQGPLLDTADAMGGRAIAMVRVQFSDARLRHRGISHHVMTALTRFCRSQVEVPLPILVDLQKREHLEKQADLLARAGHKVTWHDGKRAWQTARRMLKEADIKVTTMGRDDTLEPDFFYAAAAAAKAGTDSWKEAKGL